MSAPQPAAGSAYRTRYLQLKSVLHDRATGFSAVPALLEQLRAQLDDRRALGVLHVTIENLAQVESLYGWQVLDRVLGTVAVEMRESCGEELPAETLLAINAVAGDRFIGFVIEQTDGREVDAEFLRRSGDALQGRLQAALATDELAGLGPGLSVHVGNAMLSRNPFYRFERRVYSALEEASALEGQRQRRRDHDQLQELEKIIHGGRLETVFQPVVDLRDGRVLGYEAFSRGPAGTVFERPQAMFQASEKAGIAAELDRTCRKAALEALRKLAAPGKVFLNTLPHGLAEDATQQAELLAALEEVALAPQDLVLEFSEREAQPDPESFAARLGMLKKQGFGIALDDIGTGYASQAVLEKLRPDFLKLDGSLVRGIEANLIKQQVIASLIRIAANIGASVIAENVETDDEVQTLVRAGAQFGQGYLFGAPAAPDVVVLPPQPGQEH